MPVHGLASHCVLPCAVGTCVCVCGGGGGGGEKLYLQEVTQLLSMILLHAISINAETMVHVYGSNLSAIFGLRHSTCVAGPPSTALSGGVGGGGGWSTSATHWICSWASPNTWCYIIEKQAHAMIKTKDLYSAYCPTGGCTQLPLFCSSVSTVRLLHSYVCPSNICVAKYVVSGHNQYIYICIYIL